MIGVFDPGRHPGDLGSQACARDTTGEKLVENYANVTCNGSPADMQLLASIAIARVLQLEDQLVAVAPQSATVIPLRRQRPRVVA